MASNARVRGPHALAHGAVAFALAVCGAIAVPALAADLPRSCDLVFIESTAAAFRGLAHLQFRLHYTPGKIAFGSDPVACSVHPSQVGATGSFVADDTAGTLDVDLSRQNGLLLEPLAVCTPQGAVDAETSVLTVDVLLAENSTGQPLNPSAHVDVDTFECSGATTLPTTTTLPVTTTLGAVTTTTVAPVTTTTLSGAPVCGDGDGNGTLTAADALLALRTAVGAASCSARCDTDANGSVTAADALRILRAAVGVAEPLTCP